MAITCHDLDSLLPAHLDGELHGAELAELLQHLGACASCAVLGRQQAAEHRELRALLVPPAVPGGLRRDVLAALDREDHRRPAPAWRRWALPGVASAAAAAALTLFAAQAFDDPSRLASTPVLSVAAVQREAVASRQRRAPLVPVSSPGDLSRSVAEYLRVPVTTPHLTGSDVRGWQPTQLAGRVAAKLVYEVVSHGVRYVVDVHLLDGRDLGPEPGDRFLVNGTELWVSSTQGFHTVAHRDRRGVGYVFSSEMPRNELIDVVVSSDVLDRVQQRVFGD